MKAVLCIDALLPTGASLFFCPLVRDDAKRFRMRDLIEGTGNSRAPGVDMTAERGSGSVYVTDDATRKRERREVGVATRARPAGRSHVYRLPRPIGKQSLGPLPQRSLVAGLVAQGSTCISTPRAAPASQTSRVSSTRLPRSRAACNPGQGWGGSRGLCRPCRGSQRELA